MDLLTRALSPWGENIFVHISWSLFWASLVAGAKLRNDTDNPVSFDNFLGRRIHTLHRAFPFRGHRSETWTQLIIGELLNPAPEVRHAAAYAAGEIGDEEAIEPLKQAAVEDPDHDVQLVAISALGEIGGPLARVALKAVLFEGDSSLEEPVQQALASIDFDEDPLRPGSF